MKITNNRSPLAQGLVHEDYLPLRWELLEQLPSTNALNHLNESNESHLRIFASLEDPKLSYPGNDEHFSEISHDLTRVELKLNLLLELTRHVLSRQLPLPDRCHVWVGAYGIEWQTGNHPPEGKYVMLDLFLMPHYPLPIELPGQVIDVQRDGELSRVIVAYQGLSEASQDWIEKINFRHHRRKIANQRSLHE
jgi:hypothetical protein